MKTLIVIILISLISAKGKSQNRNISIQLINKDLKFDSARIIIDSVAYNLSLTFNDTTIINGFNPDTTKIKNITLFLFKEDKNIQNGIMA